MKKNKVGYTATLVTCGWAGAILEVTRASVQELYAQPVAQGQYVPVALLCMLMVVGDSKQGSGPEGDNVL